MVDGVGEPRDGELELALNGRGVVWVVGVPGVPVVAVQRDADFATVLGLEFRAEHLHCSAVGAEEGVPGEPGFGAAIADGVDGTVAAAAWRVLANRVAEAGGTEWLVEGTRKGQLEDGNEV